MITRKSTFFFGVLVLLLPFTGFPAIWKTYIFVFIGVVLTLKSIEVSIPRKVSRSKVKKHYAAELVEEDVVVYPKDNIVVEKAEKISEVVPVVMASKPIRKKTSRKVKVEE